MDIQANITTWCKEALPEDLFLVEIEQKPGSKKLTIYIDGDKSVDISNCQKLSRYISEKLDELDYGDEPYQLEVSSPGADKPLKDKRQYTKHIGRELAIKLKAETELTGKLEEVSETGILIALKDKKKNYKDATTKHINFDDLAQVSVILSFK